MNTSLRIAGLVGAGALALGAIALPAIAHERTPEELAERSAARAEKQQAFADVLADELGVDADDVATALENVHEAQKAERRVELGARLDEKVADGSITQEQADEMLARFDESDGRVRRGGFGRRGHGEQRGPRGPRGHDLPGGEQRGPRGPRGHDLPGEDATTDATATVA